MRHRVLRSRDDLHPSFVRPDDELAHRAAFEEAPIGIAHLTLDGRVARANRSMLQLFGLSAPPRGPIDFDAFTHPLDRDIDRGTGARLYAGEIDRHVIDKRLMRADGASFWARVTVVLARDGSGAPAFLIVMVEDISERKRAQGVLDHLFTLSPDMIAAVDFGGRFLMLNEAWMRLGYGHQELEGQYFMPYVHPDDRVPSAIELSRLIGGETTLGFTNRFRAADGTYRWVEWHAKADAPADVIYAIGRDITDRRSLQQQFNQAQKMEAVGRLAGGVAHDFNNLLTAILGFSELALERLDESDPKRDDLEQIVAAAQSASTLTRQLLTFSRNDVVKPEILDLNEVVTGVQGLLRRVIGEDVTLETTEHDCPCLIFAGRGQIEQVLMNLAVNARDAMPDGGTLHIRTGVVDYDDTFTALNPGACAGRHVLLTVTDSGIGMDAAVLGRLFEPFFTTKDPGKGTGLGLATVYGIVKQCGGHIRVDSTPGAGTSFMISFPAVEPSAR